MSLTCYGVVMKIPELGTRDWVQSYYLKKRGPSTQTATHISVW